MQFLNDFFFTFKKLSWPQASIYCCPHQKSLRVVSNKPFLRKDNMEKGLRYNKLYKSWTEYQSQWVLE